MKVINLTPHTISIFFPTAFTNLVQCNPTTWVADSVDGSPINSFKSQGIARIATSTKAVESDFDFEVVITEYGELEGIPQVGEDDLLIVSLPTKSNALSSKHPLGARMVSPYKVVRDRQNGSIVLGCMGLSY